MTKLEIGETVKILDDGMDTGETAEVIKIIQPKNPLTEFSEIHARNQRGRIIIGDVLMFQAMDFLPPAPQTLRRVKKPRL